MEAPSAALDIGSNTIRLLVGSYDGQHIAVVRDVSEFVRLGKGVDSQGRLSEDRVVAAVEAIQVLLAQARDLGARNVACIATSAVRDAANQKAFVRRVEDETGARVEVLSGEEEARLTFLGATMGKPLVEATVVCDLGGGSSEFIFATAGGVEWARSLQLGSGRLTELYVENDPPQASELQAIDEYVVQLLCTLPQATPADAIFTGGTASHIAFVLGRNSPQVRLSVKDLLCARQLISSVSQSDIVAKYGVRAERAEILAAGVTAVHAVVGFFGVDGVTITRGGIREGSIIDQSTAHGM